MDRSREVVKEKCEQKGNEILGPVSIDGSLLLGKEGPVEDGMAGESDSDPRETAEGEAG